MNLDDALVEKAARYSGIKQKTALVHEGLRALIAREAARRLAAMGGFDPKFKAPARRRGAA
jgi:Arc/MetJ family transcription regulator